MTRPPLRSIPLSLVLPLGSGGVGGFVVTMRADQWDAMLAESYAAGDVLLELDGDQRPIRAFQRATGETEKAS